MISWRGVCESGRRKWLRKRVVFVGLEEVGEVGDAGGTSVMKAVAFCKREENMLDRVGGRRWCGGVMM